MSWRSAKQWVLAQRPQDIPDRSTFRLEITPIQNPAEGDVVVRNHYIPVDPGMRPALWAKEGEAAKAVDLEFSPFKIGAPVGFFTIGQVEESLHPDFSEGDWVTGIVLWRTRAVVKGDNLQKIDVTTYPPTAWLGALGVPGLSAWTGLIEVGQLQQNDVVVITSAAGSVGLIASQIAKSRGCMVIGVAGGPEKCALLKDKYGLNGAIDYKAEKDMSSALRRLCPNGIDLFFDNVGNEMLDAAIPLMRKHGRIVICGQVADYNLPPSQRAGLHCTDRFVSHRLTMRGLFVFDHIGQFPKALDELGALISSGKLHLPETILEGFEQLPDAFAGLFTGQPAGRTIVKVA